LKHRRRGVKREHAVLPEFAHLFERLAALPGVGAVIPGRIAHNPTRHPGLTVTTPTATGFKLLAKTTTSVQEVFVVVRQGQEAQARAALQALASQGGAAAGPARRPRARRPPRRRRPGGSRAPRRLAPAPQRTRPDPTWRRLWTLRLARVRWRHRFGVPVRRVRRPRR